MHKSHCSKPFDKITQSDEVLTRIDPALGVDIFNKFMTQSPVNIPTPSLSTTNRLVHSEPQ